MYDLIANLWLGMGVAVTPTNVLLCLIGALVGTLIGVLPGIGSLATIAMLLPITFGLPPVGALIMLAGIYYGAQYGGSTTSILVNIPGESSSVVTCLDGHEMAKQGRAGPALAIAAIGSFFAGCVATVLVAALGAPLTSLALLFGPAEYFSLMCLGLIFAVVLAKGSVLKALTMILTGLLLSMIGSDLETGAERMTWGIPELSDGIGFVVVGMGMFGFGEILRNLEQPGSREIVQAKVTGLMPTLPDLKAAAGAIGRGTVIGSLLGILPGGGAIIASFAAYTLEKRVSKNPERFGRGAIEGVAAPESANNAAAQTSFIPLLTLGIPPNPVMALMVGAMTIHGIVPGPQVMTKQPELFWGMIASMWIGNLMLVVINLPLVGMWVRLLRVPYRHLFPMIVIFCCIGVYSLNNAPFDVSMTAIFGVVGYWLVKHDFEPAPMILGFVLGPLMEENLRRAMLIARGDAIGVRDAADLGDAAGDRAVPAGAGGAAVDPRQARRGVHRVGRSAATNWHKPRRDRVLHPLGVFLCSVGCDEQLAPTHSREATDAIVKIHGSALQPACSRSRLRQRSAVGAGLSGPSDHRDRAVRGRRPDRRDRAHRRRSHVEARSASSSVIENVVGAGGTTGSTRAKRADARRLHHHHGPHGHPCGVASALYPNLHYDPANDFEPIGMAAGTPILILAKKDFPPKDLKEFVAYVKANETKLNMAHAGVGSVSFTTCLLLNSIMKVKPTSIPFRAPARR